MKRKQPPSSPCRDNRTRKEPPAWYCRIVILTTEEDRNIELWDFDEDISELGEGDGDGVGERCECDSDIEVARGCECEFDPLDDGEKSQHSYTGSDAGYYYELKAQRIERKMELYEAKEKYEREKKIQWELERRKEQEVYAAYEAILEAEKKLGDCPRPRLESISNKVFYLFSVDHVNHCFNDDLYPSKYVEFYSAKFDDEGRNLPDPNAELLGHVYFNADTDCTFVPFRCPEHAGSQETRLKILESDKEPVFRFISDKYLIMTVGADSEMIQKDIRGSEAADVPDVFKFVGIHMTLEERRQGQAELEKMLSRR
ncbi:hypothetical protein Trco_004984 [Trichoderma cornu-damae]|uniref:Uncharacterized protein n=1 Tax=Trichoderma cornu-damae TaxID=654480 RepID=A0A9P8QGP3_9HYPO|nr:hypothetical protein Trco_004984 [Trichoderma cornu-damae]